MRLIFLSAIFFNFAISQIFNTDSAKAVALGNWSVQLSDSSSKILTKSVAVSLSGSAKFTSTFQIIGSKKSTYSISLRPYFNKLELRLNNKTLFSNLESNRKAQGLFILEKAELDSINSLELSLINVNETSIAALNSIILGDHFYLAERKNAWKNKQLIKVGIFLMAAIFAFAMLIAFKFQLAYLFLALFSISQFSEFSFGLLLQDGLISAAFNPYLRQFYLGINLLHGLFLTLFLITHYELKKLKLWVLACFAFHFISVFIGESVNIYGNLIYAIAISTYAIYLKRSGSLLILTGLLLFLFFASLAHLSIITYGFSIAVICLIFLITLSISQKIKEQNEALSRSKVKLAQAESELLRRSIQPHFIMNTLLSIIAWIKKEPDTAILQIEALAEEFDLLNQLAEKPLISLGEEIELCQNYLKLMAFRKNVNFKLRTENLILRKQIPPMIFHTLIENGITHSYKEKLNGEFLISYKSEKGEDVYSISNDGQHSMLKSGEAEGIGFSYIRRRLEDAFPSAWSLDYGVVEKRWQCTIRIKPL